MEKTASSRVDLFLEGTVISRSMDVCLSTYMSCLLGLMYGPKKANYMVPVDILNVVNDRSLA